MRKYKEIEGTLIINGNDEGFRLTFPTETADRLCDLYRTALASVLKNIEVEKQYKVFDKWLKETEPELYDAAMRAFAEELDLRLRECLADGDDYCCGLIGVEPPCGIDDGCYWPDERNEIAIESFKELKH